MRKLVDTGYFGEGNIQVCLGEATERLYAWLKWKGKMTALRKFSVDNLVLKPTSSPKLALCQYVGDWLAFFVLFCVFGLCSFVLWAILK